jgi:hypothetical protein
MLKMSMRAAAATPDLDLAGANLLARWQRQLSSTSALEIQGYYDQAQRFGEGGGFVLRTYDVSLQHSFAVRLRTTSVGTPRSPLFHRHFWSFVALRTVSRPRRDI